MEPRQAERRRRRRGQIVGLAVVWAVGVSALVIGSGLVRRRATDAARAPDSTRSRARPPASPAGAGEVAVDIARLRLHSCGNLAVAFRSRDDGWVTDVCGEAFHTADGGVTFAALPTGDGSLTMTNGDGIPGDGHVGRIEWLSDRRGVAFAINGLLDQIVLMVTTDAGATWQRTALPWHALESFYASAHVGDSVWACGYSGRVIRSRDAGARFEQTRRTPFDQDDRCMALSFLDDRHGWAGGMDGTLFETFDGGDSWSRLRPPRQPRPTGATTLSNRPVFDVRVSGVALLSPREGWVTIQQDHGGDGTWTFVTGDGGRTWVEAKPPAAIAARLRGGSAWGEDGAVIPHDGRLAFYAGGELVRETPLVGAARGPRAPEIIRAREPLEPGHLSAWTDHALLESFDDGRSWSALARVPDGQPIRRVVHPGRRETAGLGALVELADGRILRGWNELSPSDQPVFDRFVMDMTEAHRRGAPPPAGPLDCLATAAAGRLEMRGGKHGCDFSHETGARLEWDGQCAALTLPESKASLPISDQARRAFVARLAAAVQRPNDGHDGCTTELSVDLTWRCGAAAPLQAGFSESDCAEAGEPPETGPAHRAWQALQALVPASATGKGER
jgi:photosystem II stability/assembly factor-like uncharacterized protein